MKTARIMTVLVAWMALSVLLSPPVQAGWPMANRAPGAKVIPVWPNLKVPLMVNSLTPPSFIGVARNDTVVPLANSIEFYHALKRQHIPVVLRIYNKGEHGFGLGIPGTDSTKWPAACARWLRKIGMIKRLPVVHK